MKNEETNALNLRNETKKTTKEKIFDASVDLFSKRGFNDVPVREIAKQAGIREGSIYNHYKNKEAILDTIIDYFKSEMSQSHLSDEESADLMNHDPEMYFEVGIKKFMERSNNPLMDKIRRLLCIEIYRNEKIREFFKKQLLEEPLEGWENIFRLMIEKKIIKPVNPRTLAYEYWSFAIFLFFDCYILRYEEDFDSCMKLALERLTEHTRFLLEAVKI